MHISLEVWVKAGFPAMSTVGEPGAQGAVRTGIQGIGVRTPKAAAVAAATIGFAGQLHMPNGIIFTIGLLSIMVANGILLTTLFTGSTFNTDGAAPKLQAHMAPPHTAKPIFHPPFKLYEFLMAVFPLNF